MIRVGVDGLSRGDKNKGVMTVVSLLDYIPLPLDSIERSLTLLHWIRSWYGMDN